MAVATVTLSASNYPYGHDNSQRRQRVFGGGVQTQAGPNSPPSVVNGIAVVGASPSYVSGGIRMNFANLETIKTGPPYLLPQFCYLTSLSGSGLIYQFNPLGPAITNLALTTNVVTITALNNLAVGDVVVLSGLTTTPALNGTALVVLAGSLSATQFTANLIHANIGSGAETGWATPSSYASGLPFQGNLQIFQSAATVTAPNPLAELGTGAFSTVAPKFLTDVLAWEAEFVRAA
jgi:hypothetical protein